MRKIIGALAVLGLVAGLLTVGAPPAHAIDWKEWTGNGIRDFKAEPGLVVFDSPAARTVNVEFMLDEMGPPPGVEARFVRALWYDQDSCDYYSFFTSDFRTEPYDFSQCDVWGSTTESKMVSDPNIWNGPLRNIQFDIAVPNERSNGSIFRVGFEGHNPRSFLAVYQTSGLADGDGYIYNRYFELEYYESLHVESGTRSNLVGPSTAQRGTPVTFTGRFEAFYDSWAGIEYGICLAFVPDARPKEIENPDDGCVASKSDGTFSVTTPPISESGTWYTQLGGGESAGPLHEVLSDRIHVTATGTGALLSTPIPKISGTARVGSTLATVPGAWTPAPVTLNYQWKRNGRSITGATGPRHVLTAADRGQKVTVTVTGSKPNYNTVSKTSVSTSLVAPGIITPATPKLSGTAKKGKTLKVVRGTWKPAGVTLKYQWKRNGKAIKGATKSSYKLTKKDTKKHITITVTGSKTGYSTVARTSAKSSKVK